MRDAETLTMSAKELDRLEIIGRVVERRLTQRTAADRLGLSLRHVERLCRAFRRHGAAGLVSRKRGHPSNRKLAVREQAVDLVRGTTRILVRRWRARSSRSSTASPSRGKGHLSRSHAGGHERDPG